MIPTGSVKFKKTGYFDARELMRTQERTD